MRLSNGVWRLTEAGATGSHLLQLSTPTGGADLGLWLREGDCNTDVSNDHGCCGDTACNDTAIQACVCAVDSYCCTAWDSTCGSEVFEYGCGFCPCMDWYIGGATESIFWDLTSGVTYYIVVDG